MRRYKAWKPKTLRFGDAAAVNFRLHLVEIEILLVVCFNVKSSSSTLHDDLAAHTARIRSTARFAALLFNDIMAVRRLVDQRPEQFVSFQKATRWQSGGAELARGLRTNRDELNDEDWDHLGGNNFVAMLRSVIKAAP